MPARTVWYDYMWFSMRIKNQVPTLHPDLAAHNQLVAKSLRNKLGWTRKESTALTVCLKQDWITCQCLFEATHRLFKEEVKVCLKKNFLWLGLAALLCPLNFWSVWLARISASVLLCPRFWSLTRKKDRWLWTAFGFPRQVLNIRCVSPEINALKTPLGWQEIRGM